MSSSKLIKVPTELLNVQATETPATETTTTSPLTTENVQTAVPVVNAVSPKNAAENVPTTSAPAEQVATPSVPDIKVDQLVEDASKTTSSSPIEALKSTPETKIDAAPAIADIPVNEPIVIKKEAYVTTATTDKPVLTRQDTINHTEEVVLEVIAPFADSSKPDQIPQTVTPALQTTISADSSKIPSDTQNSVETKDPTPNATTANEKLEPGTLKEPIPSSNVVPNIVTETPSKATETTNLTTAAPALPNTTQEVVQDKIAPQVAVTTTNTSGPEIATTSTSPSIHSSIRDESAAVPATLLPKTDDSAILNNGTPESLPNITNETDHLNAAAEGTTTNSPSSSKLLQLDDPVTEAKILLQDDDLNATESSSEDWNSFLDDSVEDYENTTDSIEARDSNEIISPTDGNTIVTPPSFIDPYESLKNQDNGYQVTSSPASSEIVPAPSPSTHHDHHHHNHDHNYPSGGQVPPFYPLPNYPSSVNSVQGPVETAQSASDASSEVVNVSIEVPIEDSVAVPEGVGSVEQILPPLLDVPTIEENIATETVTIDDGPGMFSNLWNSITGMFVSSDIPDDSQLQQDAIEIQQNVNDMLFTTPEEAAAAKPAIVGEYMILMFFDNRNKRYYWSQ